MRSHCGVGKNQLGDGRFGIGWDWEGMLGGKGDGRTHVLVVLVGADGVVSGADVWGV